jgi:type IV pilus assembly protein PilM
MFNGGLKMFGKYVGIDIGSDSIKLFFKNKTYEIKTPEKSIENGAVLDISKLGETIKTLVMEHKLEGKKTVIVYNGPSAFSKLIKIPSMENKEVKNYLKLEAENIVPFAINDGVLDYIVLEDNKKLMEILVIAIKNELIIPIIKAAKLGGLQPMAITIPGLSLSRMIFKNKNKDDHKGLQLAVDIGKATTDIHIYIGGTFRFSRIISIGGDDFDNVLMSSTGVNKEQALDNRITNKYDPKVFSDILSNFQRELVRSIDYFRYHLDNQENTKFDKVFLLGGNSNINETKDIVQEVTQVKCTNLDDSKNILVKSLSMWKQSSDINLLPIEYRPKRIYKIKKIALRSAMAILTISAIAWFALIRMDIARTNRETKTVKNDINKLQSFLKVNKEDLDRLQKVKDIVISVEGVKLRSISHTTVLDDLRKHAPENVQLKTLFITHNEINLSAQSPNLTTLSLFLDSLNAWGIYEKFSVSQINFREGNYTFSIQGNRKGGHK